MAGEKAIPDGRRHRWADVIVALSGAGLKVEMRLIQALMFLLCGLVLLNIVTRYARVPIYWVDESSVYSIVWLTFIGASAMTRLRLDFAVTLLTEKLSERAGRIFRVIATACVVFFGIALTAMCWIWLDPLGIAAAGFDAREYAGQSFNFIYTERTQTLNWPTWVLYLIMPLFAVTLTMHAAANLVEDLGFTPRRTMPGFSASAEAVT